MTGDAVVEKLPLYVNVYPDGRSTLTCAHCAVDAGLEGARVTALYTEHRAGPGPAGTTAIIWQTPLTPEEFIVATRTRCRHLDGYGPRTV